jgi:integrase
MAYIQKVQRKKGVTYRVFIRPPGLKPITKTFATKREAVRFVNRLDDDKRQIQVFQQNKHKTLLSKVIDDYLVKGYKGQRPKEEEYKLNYWKSQIGIKQISEVSRMDISNSLSNLPSHLSNATTNRYKAAISVVFTYACRYYNLLDNPVNSIPSRPENNSRIRYLSNDERALLFKAVKVSKWSKLYLITLMAITTGARKGELLNLKWGDLDFNRNTAYVSTTKNGEPKVLPLVNEVITELNRFKQDSGLIFNSEIKLSKPYDFFKLWKKALKKAEIKDFRFHDLRHTTASYLAMSGASLLEIADVLGHKQIQMTKRYSHLCIDHKQKLIDKIMSNL